MSTRFWTSAEDFVLRSQIKTKMPAEIALELGVSVGAVLQRGKKLFLKECATCRRLFDPKEGGERNWHKRKHCSPACRLRSSGEKFRSKPSGRFLSAAANHRRRAERLGLPATITRDELVEVWLVAGGSDEFPLARYGVGSDCWQWDHVDSLASGGAGSVKQNMQPRWNNQRKGTRTEDLQAVLDVNSSQAERISELESLLAEAVAT